VKELDSMNTKSQQTMKAYWMENTAHRPAAGGCLGKGRGEIVDPGANKEAVFRSGQLDSQSEGSQLKDSLHASIFVSLKKNWMQRPTPELTCFRSHRIEKWTVKTQPNF
jgi:hypothetical protein